RRMELAERKTLSLDDLSGAIAEGEMQTLNLIIKGDVAGSVEALADSMAKLELPEGKIHLVRKAAGAVTEDDVRPGDAPAAGRGLERDHHRVQRPPRRQRAPGDRGVRRRPAPVLDHLPGHRGHRARRQGPARA